ncbi:MAG: sulfatase-like hydrolase/transferase [Limisphaerales bacterium]
MNARLRPLLFLSTLLVGVALTAAAPPVRPPNFVFLLADDMRPDAIGALGHPVLKTPHLDSLVREGVMFTRAVAAYPICHVSRAEMLTGCTAFRSGVQYRGAKLDPKLALWPETLRRAGYATWYSGKWHTDGQPKQRGYTGTRALYSSGGGAGKTPSPDHAGRPATGYVGWTFKTDDGQVELDKGVGLTPDTDRFIVDGAVEVIRRKPEQPFFLHVNFTGPHDPRIWPRGYENRFDPKQIPLPRNFAPQHPFDHGNAKGRDEVLLPVPRPADEVRAELAVYYAVIAHLDEQVGRILAALKETGQLDNTVVIFSSDQGLAVGSHGLIGKQNLYEHTFRVPLILRGPGIPRGQRLDAACYLRDLFPTTCELASIAVPDTVQGRSLAPVLSGKAKSAHPHVIGYFTNTQRAIRHDRWKLIWYPQAKRDQLFDLTNDPDELRDLASAPRHAGKVAELKAKLEAWLKENGDPLFDSGR